MGFITTLATLAVGVAIGLIIGLVAFFKKKKVPAPVPVDKLAAWEHLSDLTKKKAELLAKKKALQEAYQKGSIDEKTYVEESAKLDSLLESNQKEMDETMYMIAKGLVPEFMIDAEKEKVKLEKVIRMSENLEKLKKELEEAKSQRDSLYMQINELEEEKKDILAKYNWLQENSAKRIAELQNKVKNLQDKLINLERENQALKEEVGEATKPESERIKNLKAENQLLKEELENLKKKLNVLQRELAVMGLAIRRYEKEIRKGETKSIEELKSLITPDDPTIKALANTYNTLEKAYNYVRDNILEISPTPGIPFWMTPSETVQARAGDNSDRALLLASLLNALGIESSVLFVETTKGEDRALVLAKAGDYYLLDLDQKRKFNDFVGKTREEAINKYSTGHGGIAKIRYEISPREAKILE